MEIVAQALTYCSLITICAAYLRSVAWAVGDAQRRGQSGGVIVLLFCLLGPFASLSWLILRPRRTLLEKLPSEYNDPDEAISAAARLNFLGDWDASINFYHSIADRWPEHAEYSGNCIGSITLKQRAANA